MFHTQVLPKIPSIIKKPITNYTSRQKKCICVYLTYIQIQATDQIHSYQIIKFIFKRILSFYQ